MANSKFSECIKEDIDLTSTTEVVEYLTDLVEDPPRKYRQTLHELIQIKHSRRNSFHKWFYINTTPFNSISNIESDLSFYGDFLRKLPWQLAHCRK